MQIIENAMSKWSVLAGVFFTTVWGALAVTWATIDPATQESILADFGLGQMTANKALAYLSLLAALSSGVTLGLRLVKQKAKELK